MNSGPSAQAWSTWPGACPCTSLVPPVHLGFPKKKTVWTEATLFHIFPQNSQCCRPSVKGCLAAVRMSEGPEVGAHPRPAGRWRLTPTKGARKGLSFLLRRTVHREAALEPSNMGAYNLLVPEHNSVSGETLSRGLAAFLPSGPPLC